MKIYATDTHTPQELVDKTLKVLTPEEMLEEVKSLRKQHKYTAKDLYLKRVQNILVKLVKKNHEKTK